MTSFHECITCFASGLDGTHPCRACDGLGLIEDEPCDDDIEAFDYLEDCGDQFSERT